MGKGEASRENGASAEAPAVTDSGAPKRGARTRSSRAQSAAGSKPAAEAASTGGSALDPERMLLDALDARTGGRGGAQTDTPTLI